MFSVCFDFRRKIQFKSRSTRKRCNMETGKYMHQLIKTEGVKEHYFSTSILKMD